MKAEDFRIGDYVYGVSDRIEIVIGIGKDACITDHYLPELLSSPYEAEYKYLKPIPLTEEILLKCGFEKHSVTGWFMGKGRTITIDLKIGLIYINGNIVSKNKNLFRYLHQLQNLYFALTNEELTVNL